VILLGAGIAEKRPRENDCLGYYFSRIGDRRLRLILGFNLNFYKKCQKKVRGGGPLVKA
jgi:hypothetical protein